MDSENNMTNDEKEVEKSGNKNSIEQTPNTKEVEQDKNQVQIDTGNESVNSNPEEVSLPIIKTIEIKDK